MQRIGGEYRDRTTGIDLFKDGPPGSKVTGDWLNAVQEELCNFIEQSGIEVKTVSTETKLGQDDILYGQFIKAISKLGIGGIPDETKMVMHQDAAPMGWATILDLINDHAMIITKGSYEGGEVGGEIHPYGTWTPPGHSLTINEIPAHAHTVYYVPGNVVYTREYDNPANFFLYDEGGQLDSTQTGGGAPHSHGGGTWRPASQCLILCNKEVYYL